MNMYIFDLLIFFHYRSVIIR